MDDLLESMWREQLGEEAAAEAVATSESSSSFDSDLDEPPAAAAGQHSLWRPDVQPGRAVRRHVRRLERAQTVDLGAEIQRHKAMASLTVFFLNRVNRSLNLELRIPPFERWAASQHPVEGKGADPVLPDPRVQDSIFGRRLLARELVESGAGKHEVRRLLKDLDKTAVKLLGQLHRSTGDASGSVGGGSVKVTFEAAKGRYVLQYKGLALACNKTHYDKLRALFERHGAVGPSPSTAAAQQAFHHRNDQEQARDRRFHHAALAVLLRYSSVAGGTDRGGGFQGAINEEVFEVLLRCMDCRTECFASPLNCRYGRFCSAFYDTDAAFGSLGSFFDFHPTEGCFEANPPFTPSVMQRMAAHMEALLEASEEEQSDGQGEQKPLAFVVIIPAWDEAHNDRAIQQASARSWKRLRESRFCARHVLLPALRHGYIEGNQQRLPTRWKTSGFDTSVFFLQNAAARQKWPVTDEIEAELRLAFASKHEAETRARRAAQGQGPQQGLEQEQEQDEGLLQEAGGAKVEQEEEEEEEEARGQEKGCGGVEECTPSLPVRERAIDRDRAMCKKRKKGKGDVEKKAKKDRADRNEMKCANVN